MWDATEGSEKTALLPLTDRLEFGKIKGCRGNVTASKFSSCLTIESGIRMCEANSK